MKTLILVFGAGTGIGRSIFETIQLKKTESINIGFSRRGLAFKNEFLPNQNHLFDLTRPTDFDHFAMVFNLEVEKLKANSKNDLDIQIIVYFAQGDGLFKPIEEIGQVDLNSHFQLNVFASMKILQILSPAIRLATRSTLVFLSSTASKMGFANSSAYCASKHAVSGLAKAIREEWKEYNVKVVNAYLGAVGTEIWDKRSDFAKKDMISVSDAGEFLASLVDLPNSLYLDEIYVTPKKGIL